MCPKSLFVKFLQDRMLNGLIYFLEFVSNLIFKSCSLSLAYFICPLYHWSLCGCILSIRTILSDMVSSQLQLHRYATGRESRVVTALTLLKTHLFRFIYFRNHVSCSLLRLLAWFRFKLFSFLIFFTFFCQLPRLCQCCFGSWWCWCHWTAPAYSMYMLHIWLHKEKFSLIWLLNEQSHHFLWKIASLAHNIHQGIEFTPSSCSFTPTIQQMLFMLI